MSTVCVSRLGRDERTTWCQDQPQATQKLRKRGAWAGELQATAALPVHSITPAPAVQVSGASGRVILVLGQDALLGNLMGQDSFVLMARSCKCHILAHHITDWDEETLHK